MTTLKELVALVNDAEESRQANELRLAAQKLGRAAELAKGLNRPRLLAVIFMRMGQTFQADGETQHAVAAYEMGFKALTTVDDLDLSSVFKEMFRVAVGKSYQAVSLSKTVNISADLYTPQTESDLFAAADDPLLVVQTLINIGNAYLRMGQPVPAADRYKTALARPEIESAPRLQGVTFTHLGLIQVRANKLDEATHLLEQALAAFDKAGVPAADQRQAQAVLASLRFKQGETAEALALYTTALDLYATADDHLGQLRTLVNIGHIYLLQEAWGSAQAVFTQAQALPPSRTDKQALGYLHWGLGRCLMETGAPKKAIMAYNTSLAYVEAIHSRLGTDEGKVAYLDSVQEIYDSLIEAWLTQTDHESAFTEVLTVIDRARGQSFQDLLESRRQIAEKPTPIHRPPERHMRPFEQIAQTASHVDLDFNPMVQMASNIASDSLPLFFEPDEQAENQEKVEMRPPPTPRPMARLVYYSLPDQLIIIGVSIDGAITGHVTPLGENALAKQVKTLLRALDADIPPHIDANRYLGRRRPEHNRESSSAETQLKSLFQSLVQPVEQQFPKDGTPIIIEPHGALWLLPFAALISEGGKPFIEIAPLLTVPAYPILTAIRKEPDYGPPEELKALLVGNPDYPRFIEMAGSSYQMEPLLGAAHEAKQIAQLLKPSLKTELKPAEATASKVEQLLNDHQIIHLATHGIAFADDPNASFLAFAKGDDNRPILTVRDVMRQSIRADLVVLSACQTGLGKISGDGMLGLGRAFLAVGARSVIVSLWNVSDSATAELMSHFYRYYIKLDDKAIALQQAMLELRKNPAFSQPQFWAPFVLIGAEM